MTLADQLLEAQTAYHKLLTGSAVAEFTDQNGEKVVYTGANKGSLAAYIQSLQDQISGDSTPNGPMRVWF